MKRLCLLIAIVVSLSGAAQATLTLSDSKEQSYYSGDVNGATITKNPWVFSGYGVLTSIDRIEVTIQMEDGDTGTYDMDDNQLSLVLDGIDTGLLLNSFRDKTTDIRTNTVTITDSSLSLGLLNALKNDGKLVGTIKDASPGYNYVALSNCFRSEIKITGNTCDPPTPPSTVPAPGAMLLGGIGTIAAGWFRRNRAI